MNEAEFMKLRKENPQIVFRRSAYPKVPKGWWDSMNSEDFGELDTFEYSLDLVNWNDFYIEVEE